MDRHSDQQQALKLERLRRAIQDGDDALSTDASEVIHFDAELDNFFATL